MKEVSENVYGIANPISEDRCDGKGRAQNVVVYKGKMEKRKKEYARYIP